MLQASSAYGTEREEEEEAREAGDLSQELCTAHRYSIQVKFRNPINQLSFFILILLQPQQREIRSCNSTPIKKGRYRYCR